MSEQNKETTQQLKELASELQNVAQMMQLKYRVLSFWAYTEILCLIIIFVFLLFCNRIVRELDSITFAIFFLINMNLVTYITWRKLLKSMRSFNQKYHEGSKILQTMADRAEWTHYKKRLIYRGNDSIISHAVDVFFHISEKRWSPYCSERRYIVFLVIPIPFFILSSILCLVIKIVWGM